MLERNENITSIFQIDIEDVPFSDLIIMDSLNEIKQKDIPALNGQIASRKDQSTQTSNIAFIKMSTGETKVHKKSRVHRFLKRVDNFFQGSRKTLVHSIRS